MHDFTPPDRVTSSDLAHMDGSSSYNWDDDDLQTMRDVLVVPIFRDHATMPWSSHLPESKHPHQINNNPPRLPRATLIILTTCWQITTLFSSYSHFFAFYPPYISHLHILSSSTLLPYIKLTTKLPNWITNHKFRTNIIETKSTRNKQTTFPPENRLGGPLNALCSINIKSLILIT